MNYLRPHIIRGNISREEEDLLIRLHRLLGNGYVEMTSTFIHLEAFIHGRWILKMFKNLIDGTRFCSRGLMRCGKSCRLRWVNIKL